jgi:UDP-N-acetylmuramate dehydrogenase
MVIQKKISLKDKNTYKIGGNADYYCEPASIDEILEAIEWANSKRLPMLVIGKGSNLLISDMGWPGVVVNLAENYSKSEWNNNRVTVESGMMLNKLVNQVIELGYCGMEELAGIPGTIGGGIIMNAGAFSMTLQDTIDVVTYYDLEEKTIYSRKKDELDFGYRTSFLKRKPSIVLTASFYFEKKCDKDILIAKRADIQAKRRGKQPLDFPNCGSVFKRPSGNYAGTLIESCGLKGMRIGDAEVSVKHANFIINKGNAVAEDVRSLIGLIQKTVLDKMGILLEPEVLFAGEFKSSLIDNVKK